MHESNRCCGSFPKPREKLPAWLAMARRCLVSKECTNTKSPAPAPAHPKLKTSVSHRQPLAYPHIHSRPELRSEACSIAAGRHQPARTPRTGRLAPAAVPFSPPVTDHVSSLFRKNMLRVAMLHALMYFCNVEHLKSARIANVNRWGCRVQRSAFRQVR